MLVLSLKREHRVKLRHRQTGELIDLVIVQPGRDRGTVRLGIDAGDQWRIVRDTPERPADFHAEPARELAHAC